MPAGGIEPMPSSDSARLRRGNRQSTWRTRASIVVLAALILSMTSLWVLGGCNVFGGPICTAQFVYGVTARVVDADTGEVVTPAGLTLEDIESDYTEAMMESPAGSGTFVGAGERAGRYRLIVTAGGFEQKVIDEIVVNADECHVIPVALDVELSSAG
jgi:hypothetical protein